MANKLYHYFIDNLHDSIHDLCAFWKESLRAQCLLVQDTVKAQQLSIQ